MKPPSPKPPGPSLSLASAAPTAVRDVCCGSFCGGAGKSEGGMCGVGPLGLTSKSLGSGLGDATGFQAAIEGFSSLWQAKVWTRFQHTSLAGATDPVG